MQREIILGGPLSINLRSLTCVFFFHMENNTESLLGGGRTAAVCMEYTGSYCRGSDVRKASVMRAALFLLCRKKDHQAFRDGWLCEYKKIQTWVGVG